MRASWPSLFGLARRSALLLFGFAAATASPADEMVVGPFSFAAEVKGVALDIPATLRVTLASGPDSLRGRTGFVVDLADLERKAVAIAQAAGVNSEACKGGRILDLAVTGAELVPAEPKLVVRLRGKVRAWLCRPFKTHLTPELDVVAETTLSVQVGEAHRVGLLASDTRVDVAEADRLGPARGTVENLLRGVAETAQTDLQRELDKRSVALDALVAPLAIDALEARFAGKGIAGALAGRLPASAVAPLIETLSQRARKP